MTADVPIPAAVEAMARREASFEDLVAAHQRGIFRLALRMLGSVDEAATLTQDCFLRAFQAWRSSPAGDAERQRWLFRMAINLCLDRLRSRKWRLWRERLGFGSSPAPQSETIRSPERELLAAEVATHLGRALDRLSPQQRAVFVLRHYEECSLAEIAGQLGVSLGTVKQQLHRALLRLREELEEFYERPPRS